ncbi:AMP-binding protein [Roseibium sp.]|uniref:AMP-binding protein n=1 Tax=Roseibium sp. TaxID=1936156 RepID=UPI003B52D98C
MAYIGEHLETSAWHHPNSAALKCASTNLTWNGFFDAVQKLEAAVLALTVPGARVALLLSDPAATLVCFFACARAGRIAMIMEASWPKSRIQELIAATQPALCIDDAEYQALWQKNEKMADANGPTLALIQKAPPPDCSDFYAGFTSGSTGLPKGYVRSHRSWLESFRLSDVDFDQIHPHRIVLAGGVSHSLHLYGAAHGLHRGISVTLMPQFDPRTVLAELQADGGGAALYATPTQLQLIVEAARRTGPLECVPLVFCSGAKWSGEARTALTKVFPNARLVEFYGASETSFISFARSGEELPLGSVGRPADGVEVAIGDPADPAAAGVSGPVWVKSALLFRDYICGTAPETKWQDGWLTFGDHGFLDEDGFLFLSGRGNRMVITSGLNVYPEEIEAALLQHPDVSGAVVLGLDDSLRGQRLEAVVELKTALEDPERALADHCRARVGRAKCPKRFHIRDKLPLTAGGKPDIPAIKDSLDCEQSGVRQMESQAL